MSRNPYAKFVQEIIDILIKDEEITNLVKNLVTTVILKWEEEKQKNEYLMVKRGE